MYPLNGVVQEYVGGVQASTLLTERMTYKMHREGLLWSSVGQNSPALALIAMSLILDVMIL
jgi:conjugal transfer pilus assembly protein TraU